MRIHSDKQMRVDGIRKIHAQLLRDGIEVARCTVERLCRELGVKGVVSGAVAIPAPRCPDHPISVPVTLWNVTSPLTGRTSSGSRI